MSRDEVLPEAAESAPETEGKTGVRRRLRILWVVLVGMLVFLGAYAWNSKSRPKDERFLPHTSWMPWPADLVWEGAWIWWHDGYAFERSGSWELAEPQGFFYWPYNHQYLPTSDWYLEEMDEKLRTRARRTRKQIDQILHHARKAGRSEEQVAELMRSEGLILVDGEWRPPEPCRASGYYYRIDGEWKLWKDGKWDAEN